MSYVEIPVGGPVLLGDGSSIKLRNALEPQQRPRVRGRTGEARGIIA